MKKYFLFLTIACIGCNTPTEKTTVPSVIDTIVPFTDTITTKLSKDSIKKSLFEKVGEYSGKFTNKAEEALKDVKKGYKTTRKSN